MTHELDPVDVHVGAQLRLFRTQRNVSQTTLAHGLGISFQQVQKYEKGTNRVSASMLWHAAEKLGVSIGAFFDGLTFEGSPAPMAGLSPLAVQVGIKFDDLTPKQKGAVAAVVEVMHEQAI